MISLKPEYIRLKKEARLYNLDTAIVGLTGGIATGKSTAGQIFQEENFSILNADQAIKEIYKIPAVLNEVSHIAPTTVEKGQINFSALRALFFNDLAVKAKIEKVLFSHFEEQFKKEANACLLKSHDKVIIYDVPLLFEKKLQPYLDLTLFVYSPAKTQLDRLMTRDKIEKDLALKMLAAQIPVEDKKKLADIVIDNSGDLNALRTQILNFKKKYFISL